MKAHMYRTGGDAVLCGGKGSSGRHTKTCFVYNKPAGSTTRQWTLLASMALAREKFGPVQLDGDDFWITGTYTEDVTMQLRPLIF